MEGGYEMLGACENLAAILIVGWHSNLLAPVES